MVRSAIPVVRRTGWVRFEYASLAKRKQIVEIKAIKIPGPM